jgi:phage/plasmid-associated DNA primase
MSTPIEDLDKQFALSDLPRTCAILSHESDGSVKGIETQNSAKKLATGEPVSVEAKYRPTVQYSWQGLFVQAFNDFPTFKGRGGALLSGRAIGLRHERNFRKLYAKERKYIKDDLIQRDEVREYMMLEAIKLGNIDDYDTEIITLLQRNMNDVREQGSKTWMYLSDVMPLIHEWRQELETKLESEVKNGFDKSDFVFRLPIALLYGCYKVWTAKYDNNKPAGLKSFTADLAGWIAEHPEWKMVDRDKRLRVPRNMLWHWTNENGALCQNPLIWQYCPEDDFHRMEYDKNDTNVARYVYVCRCDSYRGNIEYVY